MDTDFQTFPFGLFELDPTWKVRKFDPDNGWGACCGPKMMTGKNFLSEIPFITVDPQCRARFLQFRNGRARVDSFYGTATVDGVACEITIHLARVYDRINQDEPLSILLHLRKG